MLRRSAPSTASSALLSGEKCDLTGIAIDDERQAEFNKRVYAIARRIPPGQTMTYGEIAERLGDKSLARAVGQAMGENPTPVIMPCHRVLAASGKTGGFSAPGGVVTKLRLLTIEGAQPSGPTLFDTAAARSARRDRAACPFHGPLRGSRQTNLSPGPCTAAKRRPAANVK